MSNLPFYRGYYCGHGYQFPQYPFSEHQKNKNTESNSSQDSVRTQVPSNFYHGMDQNSYSDPFASLGQNGAASPFIAPNLKDSDHLASDRSNHAGCRSLDPKAPNFGVAHSCAAQQQTSEHESRNMMLSIHSSDQTCTEKYPASRQQSAFDYHVHGVENEDSIPQIQGFYEERHMPDQFGVFGTSSSMNQCGQVFHGAHICCSSGPMISSMPNFAPTGTNYHGIPYTNYPLVAYGQDFDINFPNPNLLHEPYPVGVPTLLPQSIGQFLNTGEIKKVHYGNKNHRNKKSISPRYETNKISSGSLENKKQKKSKHMKNNLASSICEDLVVAPQPIILQDSDVSTPIGSSNASIHSQSNRDHFEGDRDHEEIEQTTLATQQIPQKEFFSEDEIATPPKPRSRRRQSISSAVISSDPTIKDMCDLRSGLGIEYHGQLPNMNLNPLSEGGLNIMSMTQFKNIDSFGVPNTPYQFEPVVDPFISKKSSNIVNGINLRYSPTQSSALNALVAMGHRKPNIDEVFNSLPFVEYCRSAKASDFGVIKIKNIPYSVNRSEVIAFLGNNSRIISEQDYEPIHIVMERVTSKTLDCYVEFVNFDEALNAVNRFDQGRSGGRNGRLGQRYVEVEISNQQSLMQDLFPKAKNVQWIGTAIPTVKPKNPNDKFNSGFQGFLSKEELIMLVKHVEAPQRSSFAKENPQRPFECLISTLFKYPWYMVDYITIEDRDLLHKTTIDLLRLLKERLETNVDCVQLTPMLYKRVWRAAIKCQGFSPSQKDDIALMVDLPWEQAQEFGLPPFAAFWKHLWTIGARPGAPDDLILWYIAQIREATNSVDNLTLAERSAQGDEHNEPELFGFLHKHIDYGDRCEFRNQTMAQVAAAEWAGIEKILRQIFTDS
ncbi:hypothetical protein K3495_g1797 [Podosphaera aphanis]|nr:hypothetical protein K3495_g1797 [Podosphaera aphanis]